MKIDTDTVTAKDLMQTDLLQFEASTPVESAIESFEEYHVSGAPVVDQAGNLIGVISASDIVRSDHIEEGKVASRRAEYYASEPVTGEEPPEMPEEYSTEATGRETVGDWMTPSVISVSPQATLAQVCDIMSREGVHRLFVTEGKLLRGVVSSMDVVNYLAKGGRDRK